MELRVGKKYRLSKKIGGGSFGDIFHGEPCSVLSEGGLAPAGGKRGVCQKGVVERLHVEG